jgi:hypothetical protein
MEREMKSRVVLAMAGFTALVTPLLAASPAAALPAFCNTAAGRAQYSIAVGEGECGSTTGPPPMASGSPPSPPAIDPPGTQPQIATPPQIAQNGSPSFGGDDNGGRCDWASAVGWSQYAQCTLHIGPQTQDQYRLQQENENCHAAHGTDSDHVYCPDLTLNAPQTG